MPVHIIDMFIYFGIFLGFIMTLVIMTKMKGDRNIRISLALYLFFGVLSLMIGDLNFSGKALRFPYLVRLDSPLHFLYGPFALFYVIAALKPGFSFKRIYLLHLIPFLINFIVLCPLYFRSRDYKIEYYQYIMASGTYTQINWYVLKFLSGSVYLILQIIYFRKFRPWIKTRNHYPRILINWFQIYFSIQALMLLTVIFNQFLPVHLMGDPYRLFMIMLTTLIISTSVALMFFPSLLYGIQERSTQQKMKYFSSHLKEEDKEIIYSKLLDSLSSEDKSYTNPELSLPALARILNIKANHLSQVINEKSGSNFNDFINTFRVEEAKKILNSEDYKRLTIDGISTQAGFKSRTAFYKAFKGKTGMTPGQYAEIGSETKSEI